MASDRVSPDPPETIYTTGVLRAEDRSETPAPRLGRFRSFLPAARDLSAKLPRPGDQGRLSSSAAWAVAYARAYYAQVHEKRDVGRPANVPSPAYLYHLARPSDCAIGASIAAVADVLKRGALSMAAHPYADQCQSPPASSAVARATDFRIDGIAELDPVVLDDLRGQLAQDQPVIITFKSSPAFQRFRASSPREVFSDASAEDSRESAGGTAVIEYGNGLQVYVADERTSARPSSNAWQALTVVGYDDTLQAFRVINSWGQGWGDGGYAWIGYPLFKTEVRDAFVLRVGTPTADRPPSAPEPVGPTPVAAPRTLDLAGYQCAKLTLRSEGTSKVVEGFIGSEADRLDLESRVATTPGTRLGQVEVAPWPQCEALSTLEKPLGERERPIIDLGGRGEFGLGEILSVKVTSPGQLSYLYVSYIQADGSVVHLVQPDGLVPSPTLPYSQLTFGEGRQGGEKFTVREPIGRELVIVLASRSPLFDQPLPEAQSEREYLSVLRRALVYKPDPRLPDREVAAAVSSIVTKVRHP
jgi:hypothetical protein